LPDRIDRVSCGWPSSRALARRSRVIGECWSPSASADGSPQIFVSPAIAHSLEVAAIVVHELGHAAVGTDKGHGPEFQNFMRAIGLLGPARRTTLGPQLKARVSVLLEGLGDYPHAPLNGSGRPFKRDSTRLLKVSCPKCGYTCRITRMWIDRGLPRCPDGTDMTLSVTGATGRPVSK
jgi:hypothetical protein